MKKYLLWLSALGVLTALQIKAGEDPVVRAVQLLPVLGVDDFRKAMTQKEAALVTVLQGDFKQANEILGSIQHYSAPATIAEVALASWDRAPVDQLEAWIRLGYEKMPLMTGREDAEARRHLAYLQEMLGPRSATGGPTFPTLSQTTPETLGSFRALVSPPWWEQLWASLSPRSPWGELKAKHTEEEKRAWKAGRMTDGFIARLLLAEALRRTREGESYPRTWLRFALGGIDAVSFNSDPARMAVGLYRLALAEKQGEPEAAAERLRILLMQNSPTAFGAYDAARQAAWACGREGAGRKDLLEALEVLETRCEKHLNDYERMLVYPQLGAARALLGDRPASEKLFSAALELAERNRDPESKRIGLIRLNLGYGLAAQPPSDAEVARMRKIRADADKG